MDFEILHRPSTALAVIRLEAGEAITAEAGAMVSMSDGIDLHTEARGGILAGLKRSVLGGESFFINTFRARVAGEVTVAPAMLGDIAHHVLNGNTMYVQSGSYLAATEGVEMDTKWGGGKTFFSGEGLFLLKISGSGNLWVSSYGAIHEVDLAAGQKYIVDTGHMGAFEEGVGYSVRKAGGWKSTLLGGEGLVVELTGPGKVFLQTRSVQSFVSWLAPKLPGKRD